MKGSSLSGGSRLTAAGGGDPAPLPVGLPGECGAPLLPPPPLLPAAWSARCIRQHFCSRHWDIRRG